ncbi:hypothetical protein SALBM217S_05715 [Streptomyces griseoloalbus]
MSRVVLMMPPSAPPPTASVVSVRSSRPGNCVYAVAVGIGTYGEVSGISVRRSPAAR